MSSDSLELVNQVQYQIKEEESTMKEVGRSGIRLSPQEVPNYGVENHVPGCFKENELEEVEDNQSRTKSDSQEMVDGTIAETISYNVSETHAGAKLITQEIEEWQETMRAKIVALIGDDT